MEELLDRFGGLVYALARRFCYQSSDIDDAVQDIFLAIWKAAERYDRELGTEETFVAMVTRRRLIDRRRRATRRAMPTVDADLNALLSQRGEAGDGASTGEPAAEEAAEFSEQLERAKRLLATLRPEQQQAIVLSIYHGLSHEEISQMTGLPLGTVKTHVRRGLIALREAMAGSPAKTQTEAGPEDRAERLKRVGGTDRRQERTEEQ